MGLKWKVLDRGIWIKLRESLKFWIKLARGDLVLKNDHFSQKVPKNTHKWLRDSVMQYFTWFPQLDPNAPSQDLSFEPHNAYIGWFSYALNLKTWFLNLGVLNGHVTSSRDHVTSSKCQKLVAMTFLIILISHKQGCQEN